MYLITALIMCTQFLYNTESHYIEQPMYIHTGCSVTPVLIKLVRGSIFLLSAAGRGTGLMVFTVSVGNDLGRPGTSTEIPEHKYYSYIQQPTGLTNICII